MKTLLLGSCVLVAACATVAFGAGIPPDPVLLKEYRTKSIYKVPETRIEKAKYPAIDVHAHVYTPNDSATEGWIKTMDEVGLEKAIVMSGNVGERLDAVLARFGKYPKHF